MKKLLYICAIVFVFVAVAGSGCVSTTPEPPVENSSGGSAYADAHLSEIATSNAIAELMHRLPGKGISYKINYANCQKNDDGTTSLLYQVDALFSDGSSLNETISVRGVWDPAAAVYNVSCVIYDSYGSDFYDVYYYDDGYIIKSGSDGVVAIGNLDGTDYQRFDKHTSAAGRSETSVTATATPIPTKTITKAQENAVKTAKSYLSSSSFSYEGLIDQLEYEKFAHSDAVYGADNSGANWNEEAIKSAKKYLRYSAFSRDGLIGQLEYEKFTHQEAVYGTDNSGADWNGEAVECAQKYLKYGSFSRDGLYDQLEYEGFTAAQIGHALNVAYD